MPLRLLCHFQVPPFAAVICFFGYATYLSLYTKHGKQIAGREA